MSTPDVIYLIAGEDIEGYPGMVLCDDPAPSYADDPDEAVKYVRADIHESALKRQGNAAKMGMDAANKDAIWREENAKRMLSQSNPTALDSERAANADLTAENELLQDALISQGKMLSAIVNITKGQPEGWRPIWTAPKDRSVILGVDAECGAVYIGRQRFGYLGEPSQDTYAWRCDSSGRFSSPTHWMEAPKGPAKSNRGVPYGT